MGRFIDRPFVLLVYFIAFVSAPLAQGQTLQQMSPTSLALADSQASLDQRPAKPLSPGEEPALRSADRFKECVHCPEMIVVPDGTFTMGASENEAGSTADERPQHQVTLQHFAVGRSPVTIDEWNVCAMAGGCSHHVEMIAGRERDPVTGILWNEAKEYVGWLSRITGRPYRLLSEAEREYVARAGSTTAFWWGNAANPLVADADGTLIADIGIVTGPIMASSLAIANPFGLHDVHGPAYDWVEDCWHDDYVGAPADGSAWLAGDCKGRVLRGGDASRAVQSRRSAARLWFGPPSRLDYMSVRVARTLGR